MQAHQFIMYIQVHAGLINIIILYHVVQLASNRKINNHEMENNMENRIHNST